MAIRRILYSLLLVQLLTSCITTKKVTNFQDLDVAVSQAESMNYETKIKCDDELSILVSCPDMALAQQYNLNTPSSYSGTSSVGATMGGGSGSSEVTYHVDAAGEIAFPVLGKIKVEGMTRAELVEYLTNRIKEDIKDPVVTVAVTNFNITIIGAVSSPGNYTFNTERVNVVQALAEAGDLTTTSIRNDILLIRRVNGRQMYTKLDITSKELLESEDFFLEQNDILYVKQDAKRAGFSDARTIWSTALSSVTSILSIVLIFIAL